MFETDDIKETKTTVLGKTFNTEEERRTYFREELRKKLPELKKMEGFPIGEDEDILNLSDPPYYTACPNPWLNDFIEEWEEEKRKLKNQGKREVNFEVSEPYATDVSESKRNAIYNSHSYHTKVPHPAIMRYILHYTEPGDIVFDGFAGTGMTGVAASLCGSSNNQLKYRLTQGAKSKWGARRFICNDLSPIASFISYCFNSEIDLNALNNECMKVSKELKKEVGWLYKTNINGVLSNFDYAIWSDSLVCSNCANHFTYWETAIDSENKVHKEMLKCPNCGAEEIKRNLSNERTNYFDQQLNRVINKKKYQPVLLKPKDKSVYLKKVDVNDKKLLEKIDTYKIDDWIPINKIGKGDKTSEPIRAGITHVHHYFTKRNLIALSVLNRLINKSKYPRHLKFILTGMIQRSSMMNRIHVKNFFHGGGGWNAGIMKGTIHIPSIPIETSVIEQFDSRHKSLILAKKEINVQNGVVQVGSSLNQGIKNNSIDYIFTDPPFGANIMYSELNLIWESWLKLITNSNSEAIENRSQNKTLTVYGDLMTLSFSEFYRILKPNKWMTVEFSNTKAAVWNVIQNSLITAGFIVADISALDKKQGGMRSISSLTGVRQDLIISCYKPSSEFSEKFEQHKYSNVGVWEFVEEHLHHLPIHLKIGDSTTAIIERSPKILFDRLIAFYVQRGLPVPIDAGKFQKGLRERFIERDGMFFTNEQVQKYDKKKKENPEFIQLSILVSSEQDGVLWLKNALNEKPLTYQDIQPQWMQALAGVRKGDVIPELATILEENFLKDQSGRWYAPDPENEADLEKLRNGRLLRVFDGYKKEIENPRAKIKEVRVEALREGFKQCYQDKDFKTIVSIGDRIPNNLLMEDEVLLQFYDIASSKV